MTLIWPSSLNSSRPPDRIKFFQATDARSVLVSNKDPFYDLGRHPCNSHLYHPDQIAPKIAAEEASIG